MFLCIEIKHPLKLKSVLSLVINNKKVHYSTTEILYTYDLTFSGFERFLFEFYTKHYLTSGK